MSKHKGGLEMQWIKINLKGILLCFAIAIPSFLLGRVFPIIGGAMIAIILGMVVALLIKDKSKFEVGIKFISKKILQFAVILLGFGLNLNVILKQEKNPYPSLYVPSLYHW